MYSPVENFCLGRAAIGGWYLWYLELWGVNIVRG
jgi:hypothetical protein